MDSKNTFPLFSSGIDRVVGNDNDDIAKAFTRQKVAGEGVVGLGLVCSKS